MTTGRRPAELRIFFVPKKKEMKQPGSNLALLLLLSFPAAFAESFAKCKSKPLLLLLLSAQLVFDDWWCEKKTYRRALLCPHASVASVMLLSLTEWRK